MSSTSREPRSSRRAWAWVLVLTMAAAGVRFAGIGRLLPHLREPDAFIAYELQSIRGDPALVEGMNFHERYPLLLARTLSLFPYPTIPARAESDPEREHLAACAWPFFVTRVWIACLSCLLVPLTFLLARRFVVTSAALAAAFFVASSLLHILYSGEARPHGAHATLALAAVLAALWASERASVPRTACALVAAILAIGALQTGLFVLPPLAVAMFLADRGAERATGVRDHGGAAGAPAPRRGWIVRWSALGIARWPALAVPLVACAVGVVAFYPTLPYVDAQGFHTAAAEGGGHSVPFGYLNALGSWRSGVLLWMHDPLLAILTASGIILGIAWWRREHASIMPARRRAVFVAAAYALPYLAVISLNGEVYDRFLMPLLPYCACFAGGAFAWILDSVRAMLDAPLSRKVATGAVVFACCAWPAYAALQFARVARAPDTLQQTAEFLRRNARAGDDKILASPSLPLPLLFAPETVREDLQDPTGLVTPWIKYQGLLPPQPNDAAPRYSIRLFSGKLASKPHPDSVDLLRAYFDEHRPDWVVVEYSKKMRALPTMRAFMQVAQERGEIAFKSHGSAPAVLSLGSIDYQDIDDLALRIVETEAFGPPIVVFRVKH